MIKITFVGDIICEEEQLNANLMYEKYNFSKIFEPIGNVFDKSDFVVGNLETPLAGKELGYTNHKWSFNSPIEFAKAVKDVGFDLVSTANNHCLDRGVEGLYKTLDNLDYINLDHTGTSRTVEEKNTNYSKEIKGVKVSFISYTYGTNSAFNKQFLKKNQKFAVNLFRKQETIISRRNLLARLINKLNSFILNGYTLSLNLLALKKEIKSIRKKVDVVFVLMHSGGQYNIIPDRWTINLMGFLLKTKVQAVIGCHPHVVQKAFVNENEQIGAYSLGNFCSFPGSDSCKMNHSEYSIVLHAYIDTQTKDISKTTFQITKSVIDNDGIAKIHLLNDLIQSEKDEVTKRELLQDNLLIYNRFTDENLNEINLEDEYLLKRQYK